MASRMSTGKKYSGDIGSTKVNALKLNMDTLRGAAGKIKNSPRLVRKKINHALNKERLNEDWIHNREQVEHGVTFNVKILGRRETKEEEGKGCTDKIVEEMVQKHKLNAKTQKLQKASMEIDCNTLQLRDLVTQKKVEDIPVKSICFCTADQTYPKVFAFMVLANEDSDAFIYAILTNKKAMADAIALTVAQAYTMSFEDANDSNVEERANVEDIMQKNAKNLYSDMIHQDDQQEAVNELSQKTENTTLEIPVITKTNDNVPVVDCEEGEEEEDEFLVFAQSRKQLDTGHISRQDFCCDVTDFLAVNNTFADLERAKSTEDLFLSHAYPDAMSPESFRSTNGQLSPNSRRSPPGIMLPVSQQPPPTGDLIRF